MILWYLLDFVIYLNIHHVEPTTEFYNIFIHTLPDFFKNVERIFHFRIKIEKKAYIFWIKLKSVFAQVQQLAAHLPTRFNVWADQET